jgi:hypothetical protein
MGPNAGQTVLTDALLSIPFRVKLDSECYGCYEDFVSVEPFPVSLLGSQGACP